MIGRLGPAGLATVLGLLGCAPSTISQADFLQRGNAVCAATAGRVAQLATPRRPPGARPEAVAGYVDAYVAEVRQELVDLRLIGYPAGERRRLARLYRLLDDALSAGERDPLSFRRGSLVPAALQLQEAGLTACRW